MSDIMLLFFEFLLLNIGIIAAILFLFLYIKKRQLSKETKYLIILFAITLLGFSFAYLSLVSIRVQEMGFSEFFVEEVIPLPYWVGVSVIAGAAFSMMPFLNKKRFRILFILSSVLLIISIRMIFPIVFVTLPAFEPDVARYMQVVDSWGKSGVDLGREGNYQHDYPISFFTAFIFIRFGVPLETFFRFAPFFIYVTNLILVYLLGVETLLGDKKHGAIAALLFSLSSLNFWIAVHYSPDLIGTFFYLLSLYLVVRFVKKKMWNVFDLMLVLLSIFLLILSHHLGTLYLVITLLGLAFSTWFFKQSSFKGKRNYFLLFGLFTYTLWFAYGTLMYPSFFNIYVYFQHQGLSLVLQQASLLDQATFLVYPVFILVLFAFQFLRLLGVERVSDVISLRKKLMKFRASGGRGWGMALMYSFGFVFVGVLLFVGFLIPATFPVRVLEVLMIGLYPFASRTLFKASCSNPSRKKTVLMFILLILVTLTTVHRYYRQIQRRVLFA